jgi:hypothetical protein
MTRHHPTRLALLAALLLVMAACGGDDDTDGTAAGAGTTTAGGEAPSLAVETVDFAFQDVPAEIPAGVVEVTLDNSGEVTHEFGLAEIGDATIDEFIADFPPVLEGEPFPDYVGAVVVPAEAEPGATLTSTFTVTEGNYVVFCARNGDPAGTPAEGEEEAEGPLHLTLGMAQPLVVGPGAGAVALPEAQGTITAVDYGFDAAIEAEDSVINFVNDGPNEVHFAAISAFPPGTSAEDAQGAIVTLLQEEGTPPEGTPIPEEIGFSGIASAGLGIQFEVPGGFQPEGVYVIFCFMSDRAGGPPHAIANDMYWVFVVE